MNHKTIEQLTSLALFAVNHNLRRSEEGYSSDQISQLTDLLSARDSIQYESYMIVDGVTGLYKMQLRKYVYIPDTRFKSGPVFLGLNPWSIGENK
jgi:hypothetical protein